MRSEAHVYTAGSLTGNIVNLGSNLWNDRVTEALKGSSREGDLNAAAKVFFDDILPELQNFMQQKIAKAVASERDRCEDAVAHQLNIIARDLATALPGFEAPPVIDQLRSAIRQVGQR